MIKEWQIHASTNAEQIAAWWTEWPNANIGFACGNGISVVDLDGPAALATLAHLPAFPSTLMARTGRADIGFHAYFLGEVPNSASKIGKKEAPAAGHPKSKIDTRGPGGYTILPPSIHPDTGAEYTWHTPPETALAPLPAWVVELLAKPDPATKAATMPAEGVALVDLHPIAARAVVEAAKHELADACKKVRKMGEGGRNDTLNAQAFRVGEIAHLLPGGRAEAVAALEQAEQDRNDPTFDAEAFQVIERSIAQGMAQPRTPALKGLSAKLIVSSEESSGVDLNDRIIECLAEHDPEMYYKGDTLVRALVDLGRTRELSKWALHERIESLVRYEVRIPRGEDWITKLVAPPEEVAEKIRVRGSWPYMRQLIGVAELPLLRPDGTVLQVPGYDPSTFLYYHPKSARPIVVPDKPTRTEAVSALGVLWDVFADFPFATARDGTAAIAAVLSVLARPAISGPVPLFAFDAPTAATGKGLICDVVSLISTGREAPKDGQTRDDEEMEKRITSVLLEGRALHVLDNVSRQLGGDALCTVTTERLWSRRKLGVSESPILPIHTVFLANGNNLQYRTDMHRRVCAARMDAGVERPEARAGFRHPDLIGYVRENQPELCAAALTILRAYQVAGRPTQGAMVPWGSYESWSAVVRSTLIWLGLPDVGADRAVVSSDQDDAQELISCLSACWKDGATFSSRDVMSRTAVDESLREVVDSLVHRDARSARGVLHMLRKFRGRVVSGQVLAVVEGTADTWRVQVRG